MKTDPRLVPDVSHFLLAAIMRTSYRLLQLSVGAQEESIVSKST